MIDITEQFEQSVKAERDGANVLILHALETPRRPLNGKLCYYELCHQWLKNAEADLYEVQGSDFTLWNKKEGKEMLAKGLFVCVDVI